MGFSQSLLQHLRQFLAKLRNQYQRLGKTKMLKKLERWEWSVLRRIYRRISEELVALAVRLRSGIRMEDIQKGCPLQPLQSFIASKARESGVRVEKVPPHYTTTTCHACGAYNGRKPSSFYVCAYCGYRIHVDANAAQNIRDWQGLCCPLKTRSGT